MEFRNLPSSLIRAGFALCLFSILSFSLSAAPDEWEDEFMTETERLNEAIQFAETPFALTAANPGDITIEVLSVSACNGGTYDLEVGVAYTGIVAGTIDISSDDWVNTGSITVDGSGQQSTTITGITGDGNTAIVVTATSSVDQNCTTTCPYSEPDCNSANPNCTEFQMLYANDTQQNATHKFRINSDGSITEIFRDPPTNSVVWSPPSSGILSPHGVTQDRNGFIYIGELVNDGFLVKLDCDGNIIDPQAEDLQPHNHVIVGNYVYFVAPLPFAGHQVIVHNLCDATQSAVGFVNIGDLGDNEADNGAFSGEWGITYNPNDGMIYFADNYLGAGPGTETGGDIYVVDPSNPEDPGSVWQTNATIQPVVQGLGSLWGLAFDVSNNLYVVSQRENFGTTDVIKFAPQAGTWIAVDTATDDTNNGVGFYDGWGIAYSSFSNKLYVTSFQEDCVAIIDPTSMTYDGPGAGFVPGSNGKAIDVLPESCYTGPSQLSVTQCASTPEPILLQDLIGCDVCAGNWEPAQSAASFGTYDACAQTFDPTGLTGQTSFKFSGQSSLCGKYEVNITVQFIELVVTADATCDTLTNEGVAEIFASGGQEPYNYDWSDDAYDGMAFVQDIPDGSYTVIVTDDAGCTASTTFDVNCGQPPVAVCQDITVETGPENCEGTAAAEDFDGGSFDPNFDQLSFSVSPPGPYVPGVVHDVTLTVSDGNETDECVATIEVFDLTPPTMICQDITVTLDDMTVYHLFANEIDGGSFDNCPAPNVTSDPLSENCGSLFGGGGMSQGFSISDETWQKSTVTLPAGPGAPWAGVTGNLPASNTYTAPMTFNNNPAEIVTTGSVGANASADAGPDVTFFRTIFTVDPFDNSNITLTLNVDNQCEIYLNGQFVALEDDVDPSNFTGTPYHTIRINSDGTVNNGFSGGQQFDNVSGALVDPIIVGTNEIVVAVRNEPTPDIGGLSIVTETSGNYSYFGSKSQFVTLTMTDFFGNSSSCEALVTVEEGEACNPQPNCEVVCPEDVTVSCENSNPDFGQVILTGDEGCQIETLVNTDTTIIEPGCPVLAILSRTTDITDQDGTMYSCTQTITIVDTVAPVIIDCPEDVTVQCQSDFTAPVLTFDDNCSPDITVQPFLFDILLGNCSITNTYTVSGIADNCGNVAAPCSFSVTANDTEAPTVSCPADVTIECDGSGNESDITALQALFSASDNCDQIVDVSFEISGSSAESNLSVCKTDFSDLSDMQLNGTTANDITNPVNFNGKDVLRLTDDLNQGGSAFLTNTVSLSDMASFSTNFEFQITDNQGATFGNVFQDGADGIVFIVQPVSNTAGGAGGGIGYQGITPSIGIEFDTWDNAAQDQNDGNHIGLNINGSVFSQVLVPYPTDFNNGSIWSVWVDYNGATQDLEVRVAEGEGAARPEAADLSDNLDVATILGVENVFVGFSSGTGGAGGDHDIRSWKFDNEFNPIDDCGDQVTIDYLAVDDCGNQASCSTNISIDDTQAPDVNCPQDLTVSAESIECTADDITFEATSVDLCSEASVSYDVEPGSSFGAGTTVVTATGTDACGNSADCSFNVTVTDNTSPMVTCPDDLTVSTDPGMCSATPLYEATATDNCEGEVTLAYDPEPGSTLPTGTTTVTVTATDDDGNNIDCSFTVFVKDQEAPMFASNPTGLYFRRANSDYLDASSSTANVLPLGNEARTVELWVNTKQGTIGNMVSWGRDDGFSKQRNTVAIRNKRIGFIGEDFDITLGPADPPEAQIDDLEWHHVAFTLSAPFGVGNMSNVYKLYVDGFEVHSSVMDGLNTTLENLQIGRNVIGREDEYFNGTMDEIRIWNVERTQMEIADNMNAVILSAPNLVASYQLDEGVPNGNNTAISTVIDATGNYNASVENFAKTGIRSNWVPGITGTGGCDDITVSLDGTGQASITESDVNADATDNCGITSTTVEPNAFDCDDIGENQVVVTVSDECGNSATCISNVTVKDMEPPTITCVPNITTNVDSNECNAIVEYDITGMDNCDVTVNVSIESGSSFPVGTTTVDAIAIDAGGNTAECSFDVTVIDNIPPAIGCPEDISVECDESTDEENTGSPTAEDNCGDVSISTDDAIEPGECASNYDISRTFTATDASGNENECTQVIEVRDTQAPEFTCAEDVTLECGDSTDPSNTGISTATDNCGMADVTFTDMITTAEGECTDTIIVRTWTFTDECGNESSCDQRIEKVDRTAPMITCEKPAPMLCTPFVPDVNFLISEGNVQATDNCDPEPTVHAIGPDELTFGCFTTHTYKFYAVDACGNVSDTCSLIVQFLHDEDAPELITTNPENLGCNPLEKPTPQSLVDDGFVSATDACGNVSIGIMPWVDTLVADCDTIVTYYFKAADLCNNQSEVGSVEVRWQVNTPLEVMCPDDLTIECGADDIEAQIDEWLASASATDECNDVSIDHNADETEFTAICAMSEFKDVTFTATDDCGEVAECVSRVSILDTTPPTISCPDDTTVGCDEDHSPAAMGEASATDICTAEVTDVTFSDEIVEGNCTGNYTINRTWTATDDCDNSTTCEQTIEVMDDTPPSLTCPDNVTIECDDDESPANTGEGTATDLCGMSDVTFSDETEMGECASNSTITRTWTATDDCDNETSCEQTITLEDTTPPVIICPAEVTVECDEIDAGGAFTIVGGDQFYPFTADLADENQVGNDAIVSGAHTISDEGLCFPSENSSNANYMRLFVPDLDETNFRFSFDVKTESFDTRGFQNGTLLSAMFTGGGSGRWLSVSTLPDGTVGLEYNNQFQSISSTVIQLGEWYNFEVIYSGGIAQLKMNGSVILTQAITFDPVFGPCCDKSFLTRNQSNGGHLVGCIRNLSIDGEPIVISNDGAAGTATATDNCSPEVSVQFTDVTIQGNCAANYTIERTYTATDDCGNETSCTQVITVVDTTPPTVTCPEDVTVDCAAVQDVTAEAMVDDECSDWETVMSDTTIAGSCIGNYVIERTFTATDDCGNANDCTQMIKVEDTTAPELTCAADLTVECTDDTSPEGTGMSTASDDCGIADVTFSDEIVEGNCTGNYTINRTWTAKDDCGNSTECVQEIGVMDLLPPTLTCPENVTIECDEDDSPANTGEATATDLCGMSDVTFSDETEMGECASNSTITRTWTATDDCGNETNCVQTITVEDTTPPELTCPEDITAECSEDMSPLAQGEATATDNCALETTVEYEDVTIEGNCAANYTIERTWTASDDCGNSTTCVQTIEVMDTTPPMVTCPDDVTVDCDEYGSGNNGNGQSNTTTYDEAPLGTIVDGLTLEGVSYTFEIDTVPSTDAEIGFGPPVQTFVNPPGIEGTTAGTLTLVFDKVVESVTYGFALSTQGFVSNGSTMTLLNENDNVIGTFSADASDQGMSFVEGIVTGGTMAKKAVITFNTISTRFLLDNLVYVCPGDGGVYVNGNATATDNCTDDVTIEFSDVVENGNCANNFTVIRTWTGTDECENNENCVQRIKVQDITPPTITCAVNATVECTDDLSPAAQGEATATDLCTAEVTDITFNDEITEGNCTGNYMINRTWTATDECGNSTTCVQEITVMDTTPPSLSCPDDLTIECDEDDSPANTGEATATDLCGTSDVTFSDETEMGECASNSTITRTWTATDDCDNSTDCVQTITVEDTTPPVLTCPEDVTAECTDDVSPIAQGEATATDNCALETTVDYEDVTIEGNCTANYTIERTWTATDDCENSTTCVQMIEVRDTTPPTVTCPEDVTVDCSAVQDVTAEAMVDDECSDWETVMSDTTIAGSCIGNYVIERTFTATDDCGNASDCTQTIKVEDTTAPELTCIDDMTVDCSDPSPESAGMSTATDDCGIADVTFNDEIVNGNCTGNYTINRTWTATDDCGNETSCVQEIEVMDMTPPSLTCPDDMTIECDEDDSPANTGEAIATDLCGMSDVTFSDETEMGECPVKTTITRTWTASDDCSNSTNCVQTITIKDTTPPAMTCPADVTAECTDDMAPEAQGMATATDNCASEVTIEFEDITVEGICPANYVMERIWTATDDCGNSTSCTQTIETLDTTPPTVTCPDDVTVDCAAVQDVTAEAMVDDECSDWETVMSDTTIAGSCIGNYVIERTFTATDDCGNASDCTQMIKVEDTTAPELTCAADLTVECTDDTSPEGTGMSSAEDDCGIADVTFSDEIVEGNCTGNYTINRTWTATDDCGNSTDCVQEIGVMDLLPPSLTCPDNVTIECDEDDSPANTGEATATDLCGMSDVTFSDETEMGECASNSTITRTWTATDDCGNSTECVQTITVEDTTPPVLTCPEDVTAECTDDVSPAAQGVATATDNCTAEVIAEYEDVTIEGNCAANYTIERTWTATDDCENSTTCVQTIEVLDTTPPTVACPEDVTVDCSAVQDVTAEAMVDDECSDWETVMSDTTIAGSCIGNYVIERTFTATDDCGNASDCTQMIKVEDTTAPELTCAADLTVECTDDTSPEGTGMSTASDDCGIVDVTFSDEIVDGNCTGNYTINRTWTAMDDCGNDTSCVQEIEVFDLLPPTLTCPEDVTIECDEDSSAANTGEATGTDLCGTTNITSDDVTVSSDCPVTNMIERTWTAMDDCGNSTTCLQRITIKDTTPPEIECPDDITVGNTKFECGKIDLDVGVPTTADNCDELTMISGMRSDTAELTDLYPVGTTTITWTADGDCSGLSSSCEQTITVIDIQPPTIVCLSILVAVNPNEGLVNVPEDQFYNGVFDNCGLTEELPTVSQTTFDCTDGDTVLVSVCATDIHGNVGCCITPVTILDIYDPVAVCQDITVEMQNGSAMIIPEDVDGGSTDNTDACGINLSLSQDVFTPAGVYTTVLTVTDNYGNSSTCEAQVTVEGEPGAEDITVSGKVWLQGPLNSFATSMNPSIREEMPLTQPYHVAPYNYQGGEQVTEVPENVIDWVLIQLRDANDTSVVIRQRAAFLTVDGFIVDLDGLSQVSMNNLITGPYYVAVVHRTHLDIVTAQPVNTIAGEIFHDFTQGGAMGLGSGSMLQLTNQEYAMWSGDADLNGIIDASDRSITWNQRNQVGYLNADVNMDGVVDASDRSITWNNRNKASVIPN